MKRQLLKSSLRALVAAMALTTVATGFARKLTPDEALSRANEFQQATASAQFKAPNRINAQGNAMQSAKLNLVYTAEKVGVDQAPAFYVFNNSSSPEGSFIITSGDDRLRPVLAMVDNCTFDPQNLPENLKWWLSEYEREINAYLSSTSSIAAPAITASTGGYYYDNYASWSAISPMVTTRWNQDAPFNNMCPTYGGQRCVTGCVATAMAQIINYHKYAKGQGGTKTYTPSGWSTKVSYDFDNAEFDWKNMLDSYSGSATTAQKNAVANLMFACGVSVDMMYSPSSSGAYSPVNGLIDYLGYHEKTAEFNRSAYQAAEWESMVYQELLERRPVYYSGASQEGGHAFVCDGYSQDGYFHINWGWGGAYDGYFALSALSPEGKGIGGFDGGYNSGQTFVRVITPNDPYVDKYEAGRYSVNYNSDFKHVSTSGNNETFSNSMFLMLAPSYPATISFAVYVVPADGSSQPVYLVSSTGGSVNQFYGWNVTKYSINMGSANLPAGDYKVYPAFYASATKTYGRLYPDGGKVEFLNMTVSSAGKRSFTSGEKYDIEISEIDAPSELYQNSSSTLTFTATNTSSVDCIDEIVYSLVGSSSFELGTSNMIIRGGETVTIQTKIQAATSSGSTIPAGTYKLTFKGKNSGKTFSSPAVNITVSSGSDPNMPDADQVITSADQVPKEWLNGEEISIPLTYSATKAGTVGLMYLLLDRGTSTIVYNWDVYYKLDLSAGSGNFGSADFTPRSVVPAGEYDFVFYDYLNNTIISQRVPVTVGLTSGKISYRLAVDGTFARAARLESTSATEITLPASVSTSTKSYPVKEVSAQTMANNTRVTRVNFPSSLTTIGKDAFKDCSSLKYLFFDGSTVPMQSASSAFSGCSSDMEVYVPGDSWSGYNSAFGSVAKVYAKITGVNVDKDVTVKKGETLKLDITTTPEQNTNPNFTVSSTSDGIATAKIENGQLVITGVDFGAVTVTLTSAQPGVNYVRINVTVSGEASGDIAAESITLDKETLELNVGETAALTATVAPDNATDKTVTWTSDNEEVATVDAEGIVTAIAAGEAVITATCGEVSAECKVTVTPVVIDATGVTIDTPAKTQLMDGETVTLTATVTPDDAADLTVTWSSSDETIATVSEDGVVTAKAKLGKVTITATANGSATPGAVKATVELEVIATPVSILAVSADKTSIEVGETVTLIATVLPENATDKTVTWSSSDETIATVDAEGVVTGVKAGEVVITATSSNDLTATIHLTVTDNSGIDAALANEPVITVSPMTITVSGVADDCAVRIFTVSGQLIAKETGNCSVALASPGVYIVKVGAKTVKASVTR